MSNDSMAATIDVVVERLSSPDCRRIVLTTHIRMDGDGLGAAVALRRALEVMGKDACLATLEPVPARYQMLAGHASVIRLDRPEVEAPPCDTLIVTDCGDPRLLGVLPDRLAPGYTLINIDHHVSNLRYGTIDCVDESASAAAEVVYRVIKKLGVPIDSESAMGIYVGLVLDTGSFSLCGTTSEAHEIAAEMLGHGIDPNRVARQLFHSKRIAAMKVRGEFLRGLEVSSCGRLAWGKVPCGMFESGTVEDNELDDLIELPRSLAGISLAMVLRELHDGRGTRVSLRSECGLDVNAFLGQYQGGGHRRAAGAVIPRPIDEVERELVEKLLELVDDHPPDGHE